MSLRAPLLETPDPGPGLIDTAWILRKRPRIPARMVRCLFHHVLEAGAARGDLVEVARRRGEGQPMRVFCLGEGDDALGVAFPGLTVEQGGLLGQGHGAARHRAPHEGPLDRLPWRGRPEAAARVVEFSGSLGSDP